ncbi:MAG TPA: hypothetical protein VFY35_09120 [Burkholderiaceae bacterium]|nr:hypothetical protein [Burkholderiaceae bacterium]
MVDQRLMKLVLGKSESQRVLVEARTTVLVVSGHLVLRGPLAWQAESVITQEHTLCAEESLLVEDGGWIDLRARDRVELMLLPPERSAFWRQVGRCLGKLFEHEPRGTLAAPTGPEWPGR